MSTISGRLRGAMAIASRLPAGRRAEGPAINLWHAIHGELLKHEGIGGRHATALQAASPIATDDHVALASVCAVCHQRKRIRRRVSAFGEGGNQRIVVGEQDASAVRPTSEAPCPRSSVTRIREAKPVLA